MTDSSREIDREALVRRHNPTIGSPAPDRVLTVGNGDFAFTADISGLQTFSAFHDQEAALANGTPTISPSTMSSWGWHEMPNPAGYRLEDSMSVHDSERGPVSYPDLFDAESFNRGDSAPEFKPGEWLHVNPQRIDLGRIGFVFRDADGADLLVEPGDLEATAQTLDLWTGVIKSSFRFAGEQVTVRTIASPDEAVVAVRIVSPLLADGRLSVGLRFPYAHDGFIQAADWAKPDRHTSELAGGADGRASIRRTLDDTHYEVRVEAPNASVTEGSAAHTFAVTTADASLELVVAFRAPQDAPVRKAPAFAAVEAEAANWWAGFWRSGAAITFASDTDARAAELERRVVLSQYLTAANCAGSMPPQETGLITNSWHGKSHLEMHFWHAAHFAAWGRPELLERSLPWYLSIRDRAAETARRQGYPGVRWPKQVGPDGRESPTPVGSLLIWQQPHLMYMLELIWHGATPSRRAALIADYGELVDSSATFMAAFVTERDGVFHLPSPVMPAQETYDPDATEDPTFELAYWWWGLEIAQLWRERAGGGRHAEWTRIQGSLARPNVIDGHYSAIATDPFTVLVDHPSLLGAFGVVPPTPLIDTSIMQGTLDYVIESWEFEHAWGWDYAVMAMTAARLGLRDRAVEVLMMDGAKNTISPVGHNLQLPAVLPLYLPGNGALLAAVSLMASTLDAEGRPCFPDSWHVDIEGFTGWPVPRDIDSST